MGARPGRARGGEEEKGFPLCHAEHAAGRGEGELAAGALQPGIVRASPRHAALPRAGGGERPAAAPGPRLPGLRDWE